MARKMKRVDGESVVTVYSHGITKNFWEYYFLDSKPDSRQNMCALVMGFEQEMGDVHVPEVQPYLMTYTKNMNNIAPAEGWEWVD